MLALALVKNFTAFLVVILGDEHLMQEVGIVVPVLLLAAPYGRWMVLDNLLVLILHQFLSALLDGASA